MLLAASDGFDAMCLVARYLAIATVDMDAGMDQSVSRGYDRFQDWFYCSTEPKHMGNVILHASCCGRAFMLLSEVVRKARNEVQRAMMDDGLRMYAAECTDIADNCNYHHRRPEVLKKHINVSM